MTITDPSWTEQASPSGSWIEMDNAAFLGPKLLTFAGDFLITSDNDYIILSYIWETSDPTDPSWSVIT